MKRAKWMVVWAVVATAGMGIGIWPCHAREVITNEMILKNERIVKAYDKAHGVMKEQQQPIHTLMDGFLMGDAKVIEEQAEAIASAMTRVAEEFPPLKGKEAEQWKLMASVIEQARIVWRAAQEGNYQKAYLRFSAMTSQCIECHQERRSWGVFPGIQEDPSQQPLRPASERQL